MQQIETSGECVKRGARWTPQEDAEVTRLHAEGATDNRIAARLGRTLPAVSSRRQELGLRSVTHRLCYSPVAPLAEVISRHFNVSIHTLRHPARYHDICWARHLAMWLAVRCGRGYAPIGRFFCRDHTSVMHAERRVEGRREADPAVRALTDALLATFLENGPEPPPAPVPELKPAKVTKKKRVASAPSGETEVCFYSDQRRGRAFLEEQNARFAAAMMRALG